MAEGSPWKRHRITSRPPSHLNAHPHAPPRQLLAEDKARGRWDANPAEGGPRPLRLTVRRGRLLEDAYGALSGKGPALKGRLYVSGKTNGGGWLVRGREDPEAWAARRPALQPLSAF